MTESTCRVMAIGAHPDDCEFRFGGTAALVARRGASVCMLSITDGGAGHHEMTPADLIARRAEEARNAAALIGAESRCLGVSDGRVEPTLENRTKLIHEIRRFNPDLILTHRPNDYHPDHRYTSQLVQDAAYLVAVPHIASQSPALRGNPRFGYFADTFTKPYPFQADVVVDIDAVFDMKVDMIACHASQVFEWLPWIEGYAADVPADTGQRRAWLSDRIEHRDAKVAKRLGAAMRCAEAFEYCEYGATWDETFCARVFHGL